MKPRLILLLLVLGASGHAQSTGTFTTTGSMTAPRYLHTATLLLDGRVLIAGGGAGTSAELYDPETGTFTPTGNMTTSRWSHTATLLADGRVLIAGGFTEEGAFPVRATTGSAELYDPATGTFTATGNMITAQIWHKATLLGNGKVLIAGGASDEVSPITPTAQLFDPATGTFAPTGTYASTTYVDGRPILPTPTFTATLLADGKVLIAGWGGSAELYDPAAGAFSLTGVPQNTRWTASLLTNGEVLFSGGNDDPGADFGAELYDLPTGTFTVTGYLSKARVGHTSTLLPDGTVLIAGAETAPPGTRLGSAELYDPAMGGFRATGYMASDHGLHTATLLNNGQVLIAGGYVRIAHGDSYDYTTTAAAELYTPPVLIPVLGLFSVSGDGQGQGAILHASTQQVASSSNPATVGEALEIYSTGLIAGSVVPPQVAIGGQMADVLFFGNAPGFAGVNQVNVQVPSGVAPGPAVLVRLTYLGRPSNEVTIGVK